MDEPELELELEDVPGEPSEGPPRNVAGEYTASMWARMFAVFIDNIILTVFFIFLQVFKLIDLQNPNHQIRNVAIVFGVLVLYQYFFLIIRSATPGKSAFGLTVVAAETRGRRPAGDAAIIKRSIFSSLLLLITPLQFVSSLLRSDRRQLADLLSGTKVIARGHSVKERRLIPAIVLTLLGIPSLASLGFAGYTLLNGVPVNNEARAAIEKATGLDFTQAFQATPDAAMNADTLSGIIPKDSNFPMAGFWKPLCTENSGFVLWPKQPVHKSYWLFACDSQGCSPESVKAVESDSKDVVAIDEKTLRINGLSHEICPETAGSAVQLTETPATEDTKKPSESPKQETGAVPLENSSPAPSESPASPTESPVPAESPDPTPE